MLDHKWDVLAAAPGDPPRNYFVPNFGIDNDVRDSLKHLKDGEAKFGAMSTPEVVW